MLEPGAASWHQGSPYVGPSPWEIGVPSHGGPGSAPAGVVRAIAGTAKAIVTTTVSQVLEGLLIVRCTGNTSVMRSTMDAGGALRAGPGRLGAARSIVPTRRAN